MKIAIIKLSALGDIIHGFIVLQFIKKTYPNSQIDWIVEQKFSEILQNNPHINQIISINLNKAKQQKSLKLLWDELKIIQKLPKYDIVIDMQGLLKSAIIAKLIPSTITAGFDKNSIREKIASWFYDKKINIPYNENIIKRNCYLISKTLNIDISNENINNKQPFLFSDNVEFKQLSITKKNILIMIGASFQSKIYSAQNYAKITQQIDANFIIVWGNDSELKLAKNLQKISPSVKIANKLTLSELTNLIQKADLVIGGDTGPVHMAWGLNTKSITLFGATPHQRNTWQAANNQVIATCNSYKINKLSNEINNISPDDLINLTKKLLNI
jgi:heptosyltransferase-1